MDHREAIPILTRSRWVPRYSGKLHQVGRVVHLKSPAPPPGLYRTGSIGTEVRLGGALSEEEKALFLKGLPSLWGHLWGWRVVTPQGVWGCGLPPADQDPIPCGPVLGRIWSSGIVLFDQVGMGDLEEASVQERIEQDLGIGDIPNVAASLRLAAGLHLMDRASRQVGIPYAPVEVWGRLAEVAHSGRVGAETVLRDLETQRVAESRRTTTPTPPGGFLSTVRSEAVGPGPTRIRDRIEQSMANSGASLHAVRQAYGQTLEVRWSLRGSGVFSTLVDSETLNIVDAGICLAGTDRRFTLDSLPSVIDEGVNRSLIVVTRHTGSEDEEY